MLLVVAPVTPRLQLHGAQSSPARPGTTRRLQIARHERAGNARRHAFETRRVQETRQILDDPATSDKRSNPAHIDETESAFVNQHVVDVEVTVAEPRIVKAGHVHGQDPSHRAKIARGEIVLAPLVRGKSRRSFQDAEAPPRMTAPAYGDDRGDLRGLESPRVSPFNPGRIDQTPVKEPLQVKGLPFVARVGVPVRSTLLRDRPVPELDIDGRQGVAGQLLDPDGSPLALFAALSASQRFDLASPVLQFFQTRARLGDLPPERVLLLREPEERCIRLAPA